MSRLSTLGGCCEKWDKHLPSVKVMCTARADHFIPAEFWVVVFLINPKDSLATIFHSVCRFVFWKATSQTMICVCVRRALDHTADL